MSSGPDYRAAPRLLRRFIGGRWLIMCLAIASGIVAGICELLPAWAIWRLVVTLTTDAPERSAFFTAALICLLAVIGKAIFFGASTATAHLIAFGVIADIRKALGATWNRMRVGELAKVHSSQAKTIALDHCEKLELFIAHALPEAAATITVWLSVTVWLCLVDWRLTLATVAVVPFAFASMLYAMRSNGYRMAQWVQANAAMGAAILDFIVALPVIRVFNRVGQEHQRTSDAVRYNADLQSAWGRGFVRWGAPFSVLVASGIAVIAPVAAWLYHSNSVTAPTLLLFLILGPTYPVPLVTLFYRLVALPMLATGAVEIEQQLALQDVASSSVKPAPQALVQQDTDVVFEHVSFAYEPGVDVLHDVSFRAAPGTITALVGVSGSGKSTIAELALGFHQPQSGRILIGGKNIAEMPDEQLYQQVSAVFQKPYLLAGTIRQNVCLANPDVLEPDLQQALDAAAVSGFLGADGLDTVLGESGAGLSGGERQRVAIARALVADRPILLLDEATAATDPDNEALIHQGLAALTQGRTVIVIAHRLSTIMHADCIHVLEQGRIVESGTHQELLARRGAYAELWGKANS